MGVLVAERESEAIAQFLVLTASDMPARPSIIEDLAATAKSSSTRAVLA